MQKNKISSGKGQSSLEFLMTYGWAIVVIAVALLVLGQWGVFNPAMNVRSTYLGFWGVTPVDFNYRGNGDLALSLQNNIIDGDINITRINVSAGGMSYSSPALNLPIASGSRRRWDLYASDSHFTGGAMGGNYNIFVTIEYIDNRIGSGTVMRSSGNIQGNIEA